MNISNNWKNETEVSDAPQTLHRMNAAEEWTG
jgi:hypothetical protein